MQQARDAALLIMQGWNIRLLIFIPIQKPPAMSAHHRDMFCCSSVSSTSQCGTAGQVPDLAYESPWSRTGIQDMKLCTHGDLLQRGEIALVLGFVNREAQMHVFQTTRGFWVGMKNYFPKTLLKNACLWPYLFGELLIS